MGNNWEEEFRENYPILYSFPIAGIGVQDRYRRVEGVTAAGDVFVGQAVNIESFIQEKLKEEREKILKDEKRTFEFARTLGRTDLKAELIEAVEKIKGIEDGDFITKRQVISIIKTLCSPSSSSSASSSL